MKVERLKIPDVMLLHPEKHGDDRGFFSETWNRQTLLDVGIDADFVQDNHSWSKRKGVLRGLHFQLPPHAQGKLVRVIKGSIFDVAVDIRRGSPSFGQHVSAVLSADNWHQLWLPKGFAHGFVTLEANTEVIYKVSGKYAPECDRGLAWNDPQLAIDWPVDANEIQLSAKDTVQPNISETADLFAWNEYTKA